MGAGPAGAVAARAAADPHHAPALETEYERELEVGAASGPDQPVLARLLNQDEKEQQADREDEEPEPHQRAAHTYESVN
jgi:hypothetical protein